ncbi:MAG: ATP-binding protein [Defluviicoccus sp.]|nr:ATP-binding protein [Defluviicoccus sp.]MDE0279140.1 ATP-binding protein [Defluviicoccus sp.]
MSGDDFFDREAELRILESRVRDRNHVLLTGQRRMGKTSLARELGRRLESRGWICLFTDVQGATCPEDVVTRVAEAAFPVRPLLSQLVARTRDLLRGNVEELSASGFGVKFRAVLNAGNWQRHGDALLRDCAAHDKPILLFIDELPIFLNRLLRETGGAQRADAFLSWLRGAVQSLGEDSPVLIVSGSIGLAPLVTRLGIPDRINHLDPFRLGPWDRDASIKCFERLARSYELPVEVGVPGAVYDALGIGIPHHVQSFFARLRDFADKQGRGRLTVDDVAEVYRTELLGPSGQNDLVHYETRLEEALEGRSHAIAMEILAEAATQDAFGPDARRCLETLYSRLDENAPDRVAEVLEVLVHDGYLEVDDDGSAPFHRFPSRLLKDWWSARYRGHYKSLASRSAELAGRPS